MPRLAALITNRTRKRAQGKTVSYWRLNRPMTGGEVLKRGGQRPLRASA